MSSSISGVVVSYSFHFLKENKRIFIDVIDILTKIREFSPTPLFVVAVFDNKTVLIIGTNDVRFHTVLFRDSLKTVDITRNSNSILKYDRISYK